MSLRTHVESVVEFSRIMSAWGRATCPSKFIYVDPKRARIYNRLLVVVSVFARSCSSAFKNSYSASQQPIIMGVRNYCEGCTFRRKAASLWQHFLSTGKHKR